MTPNNNKSYTGGERNESYSDNDKDEDVLATSVVQTNYPASSSIDGNCGEGGEEKFFDTAEDESVHKQQNVGEEPNVEEDDDDCLNRTSATTMTTATTTIVPSNNIHISNSLSSRASQYMARKSWLHFFIAWGFVIIISVLGLIIGNFEVVVDNTGWTSRGTLIANRHTQVLLLLDNQIRLGTKNNDHIWDDLINNVQPGWEDHDDDDDSRRRQLLSSSSNTNSNNYDKYRRTTINLFDAPNSVIQDKDSRSLQILSDLFPPEYEGCDISWYTSLRMIRDEHLWPMWRTQDESISALDPLVIRDICIAEQNTQRALEANSLCEGCSTSNQCLPPYSLVLFARLQVFDTTLSLSCDELSKEWAKVRPNIEEQFVQCVQDVKDNFAADNIRIPDSCPLGFSPSLVDEFFGVNNNKYLKYTSTIFSTKVDSENELYNIVKEYDRASNSDVIRGAYDTQYEAFINYKIDDSLVSDMSLALGSAIVTTIAILIHTRSPWLTFTGLCQIILSFPVAYFLYSLVAQLDFFPFLNFIAVFVLFSIGADHTFVAVDKWKNARIDYPNATTEEIAAFALPDAAGAMFLTTSTTAAAFFGTAICPVAPLRMFAIFNGLLITGDYFLCIILLFPALCLYDKWLQKRKCCCVSCHCCHRFEAHGQNALERVEGEEEQVSLIRRILSVYYNCLHKSRWVLVVTILVSVGLSGYFASTLGLPTSNDVRILDEKWEYEKCYQWRLSLLSTVLRKQEGSRGYLIWGVKAADTGNHNNPAEFSQLVLDDKFDASSVPAQEYLLGFCDDFFDQEFASPAVSNYECPVNDFDDWLHVQSNSTFQVTEYIDNCDGATGLPIANSTVFNSCISAWSLSFRPQSLFIRDGKAQIILLRYRSRIRYDSPYEELRDEWNLVEDWMNEQSEVAPDPVSRMYSSSHDYWWYDTSRSTLQTAIGSAGIALGAAAIVMFGSSRSFEITFFSLLTIVFILLSVTSMLVASGWTLGFLESICFAILIGISCDFVIHFGHAYTSPRGEVSRNERSKNALIRMGPSILAAAFTTMAGAVVMLFTVITFFQKFALILFFTIIMATAGAFIVFLTLADTFGPSKPTVFVDTIVEKVKGLCQANENEGTALKEENDNTPT